MEQKIPRTAELPIPQIKCPYDRDYICDVVVVGCGFAGLNAAVSAAEKGQKVLVVDKGRPGPPVSAGSTQSGTTPPLFGRQFKRAATTSATLAGISAGLTSRRVSLSG